MADTFLAAAALSLIPAVGTALGGYLATRITISERLLSLALHGAAGALLGVVSVEVMPLALDSPQTWVVIVAFAVGGIAFLGVDQLVDAIEPLVGGSERNSAMWAIYLGVAFDLVTDGLMIGAGVSVSFNLGLLLAISALATDLPTGFALIATFKRRHAFAGRRLILVSLLGLVIVVGAVVGYAVLSQAPRLDQLIVLGIAAGITLVVVIEEMVPQAHRDGEGRLATVLLVGGFSSLALLSAYLG